MRNITITLVLAAAGVFTAGSFGVSTHTEKQVTHGDAPIADAGDK